MLFSFSFRTILVGFIWNTSNTKKQQQYKMYCVYAAHSMCVCVCFSSLRCFLLLVLVEVQTKKSAHEIWILINFTSFLQQQQDFNVDGEKGIIRNQKILDTFKCCECTYLFAICGCGLFGQINFNKHYIQQKRQ